MFNEPVISKQRVSSRDLAALDLLFSVLADRVPLSIRPFRRHDTGSRRGSIPAGFKVFGFHCLSNYQRIRAGRMQAMAKPHFWPVHRRPRTRKAQCRLRTQG